jgi:hypothetical protein
LCRSPQGADSTGFVDSPLTCRGAGGGKLARNLASTVIRSGGREEVIAMALKNLFKKPTLTSLAKTCG